DAVKTANSFSNLMKALKAGLKDIAVSVGSSLLPVLRPVVGWLVQIAKSGGDWIKKNAGLVVAVAGVAAAAMALGVALIAIGTAAGVAASALGIVAGALAFVLAPVGLIIAALAGMTAWFATSTEAGGQAVGWLADKFGALKTQALEA